MQDKHQSFISRCRYLSFFMVLVFWSPLPSLNAKSAPSSQEATVSSVKRKLVVLPAQVVNDDPFSINLEVTRTIAGIAVELGRFEVIDRNDLTAILHEQNLHLFGLVDDSVAISLGKIAAAHEALLVIVNNFTQRGVPPEEDENSDASTFGEAFLREVVKGIGELIVRAAANKVDSTTEQYPGNIETQISIEVRNINVETSEILHSFRIDATYTGGSTGRSRSEAMQILRQMAEVELRQLHKLYTQVWLDEPGSLILELGDNVGVRQGMIFEIREPGFEKIIRQHNIVLPGQAVAYAQVQDNAKESCRALLVRQWGSVQDGYEAVEMVKGLTAGSFDFTGSPTNSPLLLGIGGMYRGYGPWDFGAGMRYMQAIDSRNTTTHGLTANVSGCLRLLPQSRISFLMSIGLMLAIPFRLDDTHRVVAAGILTPYIDTTVELLTSQKFDLIVGLGYRIAGRSDDWSTGDPEEDKPAIWYGDAPMVDISGVYATVGIKYMMFYPFKFAVSTSP